MTSRIEPVLLVGKSKCQAGQNLGAPAGGAGAALRSGAGGDAHAAEVQRRLGAVSSCSSFRARGAENLRCLAGAGDGDEGEKLLEWDELALWQQSNSFILTGHRRARPSHVASLRSVFRWHNETVNIWAHILGSLIFGLAGLLFWSRYGGREEVDQRDARAVLVYFGGCVVCFAVSSVYHISLDHSEAIRCITCQADYLSIVAPLLATTLSSTHFGFYCAPHLRALYQPLATFFALLCALATLHPLFANPTGHRMRTLVYCLLGLASFAPIVHGVLLHGVNAHDRAMSLRLYLALGCCHATGAGLYAFKWPEKWFPRSFDMLGSSHQLMHVLVVCGAACYGVGVVRAFQVAQGRMC